jgi:hypothetical protein
MIIDFASRDTKSEDGQAINLTETVERLIKNARENITSVSQPQQINTDLDSDIDAILGEKDE